MKIYEDLIQGTPEWLEVRRGKFTASKALDLFSKPSTACYQDLINNIVYERLTNKIIPTHKTEWMQRGNDLEPQARMEFEFDNNIQVFEAGFIESDEFVGMSPDGLIGDDTLLEIKCPKHTTQIGYLANKKVPKVYNYQMQFQMMVSDRDYCYFYSYHPDLPAFQVKVGRDESIIESIDLEINKAIKLVKERLKNIGE